MICVLKYGGDSSSNQPVALPKLKKVKAFSKIILPETKLLTSTSAADPVFYCSQCTKAQLCNCVPSGTSIKIDAYLKKLSKEVEF